jgi:hypothetical protein
MKSLRVDPFTATKRAKVAWLGLMAACLTLAAFIPASAQAAKGHVLEETFGSAAQPQFSNVTGVTVDQSTGDVLVMDSAMDTLSRFHADGTPAPFAALGTNVIDGKGNGQCATVPAECDQTPQNGLSFNGFVQDGQVAVDNSGTVTDGNIYVTQGSSGLSLLDVFAADGRYLGQLTAAGATAFAQFSPCGATVDENGNLYLGGRFGIYKFDPTSNPPVNTDHVAIFEPAKDRQICNLAAGAGPSAGSLFVNVNPFGSVQGKGLLRVNSGNGDLEGVVEPSDALLAAVDPSTGHSYTIGVDATSNIENPRLNEYEGFSLVSSTPLGRGQERTRGLAVDGSSGRVYIGESEQVLVYGPLVSIPEATTEGFTISGDTSLTLEGTVNGSGELLEECYFEYGLSTAYGQVAPCAESVAQIGTGEKAVHADLTGLAEETLYHYRLVAKNSHTTVPGEDKTVKTPSKPAIVAEWSEDVGVNEATLKAQVNPENSPTTYRWEWGLDSSYGQSTSEIALAGDGVVHLVSRLLTELQPGTTYHYRLVATNNIDVTEGPDRTLITFPTPSGVKTDCPNQVFRTGASATLPDCRAFELVSALDKNNGDIEVNPNGPNFPASFERVATNGDGFTYSSSTAFGESPSSAFSSQYMARRDPVAGWVTEAISPPRQPVTLATEHPANIVVDTQFKTFTSDLVRGFLVQDTEPQLDECGVPGYVNLYRRDADGGYQALITAQPQNTTKRNYLPILEGTSADGTHAVFGANGKLTPDAVGSDIYQLYEHVDSGEGCGELRLVSVLPSGSPNTQSSSVGYKAHQDNRFGLLSHAVTTDGSRIFWTGSPGLGPLYVRIDGSETVRLSAGPAVFLDASPDGSKALFEVRAAGKPLADLYEFDVESRTATLIAEEAYGVAGNSEDLSRTYFVSGEDLAAGAEAGKPNLYLRESGVAAKFIATLAAADVKKEELHFGYLTVGDSPTERGTRTSSDGGRLAFVSKASLAGYDNLDAKNGKPDLEIYLYDAQAEELSCVSCNPSGSRPQGIIGGAKANVSAELPAANSQLYTPRALSSDGKRLFFTSFEALLPRDSNGKADVYEWQSAQDAGECKELGAELYVARAHGCISLISTGQSPIDSELIDITPSGSDVFIKTAASLLVQDYGLVDIYDARSGGGYPPPPGIPPICEGEACQGAPTPPNDPTPASSAFEGAGNVVEKPARKSPSQKASKKRKHAKKGKGNKRSAKQKKANKKGRAGR